MNGSVVVCSTPRDGKVHLTIREQLLNGWPMRIGLGSATIDVPVAAIPGLIKSLQSVHEMTIDEIEEIPSALIGA